MKVATEIHVFIEIDRQKQEKLVFDTAEVTGAEIKAQGKVPSSDELFLRDGQKLVQIGNEQRITLKNGRQPRNVSGESAAGEGWFTFSFAQTWDEKNHTGLQFVEGRLRRFALDD